MFRVRYTFKKNTHTPKFGRHVSISFILLTNFGKITHALSTFLRFDINFLENA